MRILATCLWAIFGLCEQGGSSSVSRFPLTIPVHRDDFQRSMVSARITQDGRILARLSQLVVSTSDSGSTNRRHARQSSHGLILLGNSAASFQIESFHETTFMLVAPVLPLWFECELSEYVYSVQFEASNLVLNPTIDDLSVTSFVEVDHRQQIHGSVSFGETFSGSYPVAIAWGDGIPSRIPIVEFDRLTMLINDLGGIVESMPAMSVRVADCFCRLTENLPNLRIRISDTAELVFTPQDYLERTHRDDVCLLLIQPESLDDFLEEYISFPQITLTGALLQHVGMVFDYQNSRIGFYDPI